MYIFRSALGLLAFCLACFLQAHAQEGPWKLQVGVEAMATANYNLKWQRFICREGCPITHQQALLAPGGSLGLSRRIGPRHALYTSMGYSTISFNEERDFSIGGGGLITEKKTYSFLNLALGSRLDLLYWGSRTLVMSHGLLAEHTLRDDDGDLKNTNLSYVAKLGLDLRLGIRSGLAIQAVFRTAITEYQLPTKSSSAFELGNFRPIGGGVEVVFATAL